MRFLAVGTAGLAADATAFVALAGAGLPEPLARALSLAFATLLTWRLNRRITFGDSARQELAEGGAYYAVALLAQGLNFACFLAVRAAAPDFPALTALFCGAVLAAGFSYAGQRFVTFRGRVRT